MADMPRFRPADLLLLLLVVALAGGARAGYLATCCEGGQSGGPLRVQSAWPEAPGQHADDARGAPRPSVLDRLIDGVQKHHGFVAQPPFAGEEEATAHVSPGYPYLVGLLGRFTPGDNLDFAVRWLQAGLGALTAGLYYLFARRAFRSAAVGTLAGVLAALHPFWIVNVAQIDDGVLASFALAACLFLAGRGGEEGGALTSLALGLALAGLALVRAALLPFSFLAVCWYLLRTRTLQRGWLCALLAFLGFANGLAPWTVRNYGLFHEPVPVVSSAYLHLWIGNNPLATGGPATPEMWQAAPSAGLKSIASQPLRYNQLGRAVADEWRERPAESLRRRLSAGLMFLCGARWFSDGTLAERTGAMTDDLPSWLPDNYGVVFQATLLALLLLALIGWRQSHGYRWEAVPATLALLSVPLPYLLGHAEALAGPRLPLDGVLLCLAAFALCSCVPGLGGRLQAAAETPSGPPAA